MFWLMLATAVVLVGLFTWLFFQSGRWSALLVAALWFAYLSYEGLIYFRVLCKGECNIRVDLLLLWPFLFVVSIATAFYLARKIKQRRQAGLSPKEH